MSKAFKAFQKNLADQEAKKTKLHRQIREISKEKEHVLLEFDTAALSDEQLDTYQQAIEKLERKAVILNRQLKALSKAVSSKQNISIAEEALKETTKKMNGLKDKWTKLEKLLQEKRDEYLIIVARLSKIHRKEQLLRSRINQTTEVLPTVYKQTYISGVSSDIDLHRNKGLIFFDNNMVKDTFIKGEA